MPPKKRARSAAVQEADDNSSNVTDYMGPPARKQQKRVGGESVNSSTRRATRSSQAARVSDKKHQKAAAIPVLKRRTRQQQRQEEEDSEEEDEKDDEEPHQDDDDDGPVNVPVTKISSAMNEARRRPIRTINGLQHPNKQAVRNSAAGDKEDEEVPAEHEGDEEIPAEDEEDEEVPAEDEAYKENPAEDEDDEEIPVEDEAYTENPAEELEIEESEHSENNSPPKLDHGRSQTGKQAKHLSPTVRLQDLYEFQSSPVRQIPPRPRGAATQAESSHRAAGRKHRQQLPKPTLVPLVDGEQNDENKESDNDERRRAEFEARKRREAQRRRQVEKEKAQRQAEFEARKRREAERREAERRQEEEAERRSAQQYANFARATQELRNIKDPCAEKMARYTASTASSPPAASRAPATNHFKGKGRAVQQVDSDDDPFNCDGDDWLRSPIRNDRGSGNRYASNGPAATATSHPSNAWSKSDEKKLIKAVRDKDYNLYDMANMLERSSVDVARMAANIRARFRRVYTARGQDIPEWAM